jgi:cytochrome c oxidase subunit 3
MAEASPELREQHFQDFDTKAEASRLGMWIFLATEILLFGGLFVSYFYYRWLFLDAWLACTGHLDRLMGSIETLVLITSSLFAALSLGFFRRQAHKAAALCLFATAACGLAFLVLHGFEYLHEIREGALPGKYYRLEGIRAPGSPIFFALYFIMTGLHGLHVTVGMFVVSIIGVRVWRRSVSDELPIELGTLYWHLVDVVWIFLYPLLYLV